MQSNKSIIFFFINYYIFITSAGRTNQFNILLLYPFQIDELSSSIVAMVLDDVITKNYKIDSQRLKSKKNGIL